MFDTIKQLLLIDQKTGRPSHTKLLSVLAGMVMIAMFPYAVIYGSEAGYDLWLVFGAAILGNRTINNIAKQRYGGDINATDRSTKQSER